MLEQVGGVLLPAVGAVQPGDVLEVLPHGEVVVEHRLVAEVADVNGPGVERAGGVAERRSTVPAVGSSSPAASRSSVVLPLPLCPSSTTRSPAATSRSTGPSAGASP